MFDLGDVVKGLGGASIYQVTDRIFEHFLTAMLTIVMSGRVTIEESIKIIILVVLIYLAVKLHKRYGIIEKKEQAQLLKEIIDSDVRQALESIAHEKITHEENNTSA